MADNDWLTSISCAKPEISTEETIAFRFSFKDRASDEYLFQKFISSSVPSEQLGEILYDSTLWRQEVSLFVIDQHETKLSPQKLEWRSILVDHTSGGLTLSSELSFEVVLQSQNHYFIHLTDGSTLSHVNMEIIHEDLGWSFIHDASIQQEDDHHFIVLF